MSTSRRLPDSSSVLRLSYCLIAALPESLSICSGVYRWWRPWLSGHLLFALWTIGYQHFVFRGSQPWPSGYSILLPESSNSLWADPFWLCTWSFHLFGLKDFDWGFQFSSIDSVFDLFNLNFAPIIWYFQVSKFDFDFARCPNFLVNSIHLR